MRTRLACCSSSLTTLPCHPNADCDGDPRERRANIICGSDELLEVDTSTLLTVPRITLDDRRTSYTRVSGRVFLRDQIASHMRRDAAVWGLLLAHLRDAQYGEIADKLVTDDQKWVKRK